MKMIITCVEWGLVALGVCLATYKWYLPFYHKKLDDGKTINEFGKNKLIAYICISVMLAVCCGFFCASRNDAILSIVKMQFSFFVLSTAALTDYIYHRIPNHLVVALFIFRLACVIPEMIIDNDALLVDMLNCLIAAVGIGLLLLIVAVASRGGVGFGDVKLLTALSFMLGISGSVYTLILSLVICSIVAIVLLVFRKKGLKDNMPMGPFIYLGYVTSVIMGLC